MYAKIERKNTKALQGNTFCAASKARSADAVSQSARRGAEIKRAQCLGESCIPKPRSQNELKTVFFAQPQPNMIASGAGGDGLVSGANRATWGDFHFV